MKRTYSLAPLFRKLPTPRIGIDEGTALVVQSSGFDVIGTGRVAIYDNQAHPGAWYYWLNPGDRFDLANWKKVIA
jgi:hypothetical protein